MMCGWSWLIKEFIYCIIDCTIYCFSIDDVISVRDDRQQEQLSKRVLVPNSLVNECKNVKGKRLIIRKI